MDKPVNGDKSNVSCHFSSTDCFKSTVTEKIMVHAKYMTRLFLKSALILFFFFYYKQTLIFSSYPLFALSNLVVTFNQLVENVRHVHVSLVNQLTVLQAGENNSQFLNLFFLNVYNDKHPCASVLVVHFNKQMYGEIVFVGTLELY